LAGLLALLDESALGALRNVVARLHLHNVDDHRLTFDHLDTAWMLQKALDIAQTPIDSYSLAERERLVRGQRGAEFLALTDAYLSAKNVHGVGRENLVTLRGDRARWLNEPAPEELLRGRDLLALGFTPGAHLRGFLDKVRNAQLAGHLSSRAAALDFARYLAAQG
jgi:poly(A) polymerase